MRLLELGMAQVRHPVPHGAHLRHTTKKVPSVPGAALVYIITMGPNVAHMRHTITPTWRICTLGAPLCKCIGHVHVAHMRQVFCLEQPCWEAGAQGVPT